MQIHRYEPAGKYARIYIATEVGGDPRATSRDDVWERIKREHYCIDPGCERFYWDGDGEEAEERVAWFASWNDETCWFVEGPIAIDSKY